jgi:hypothetical protein
MYPVVYAGSGEHGGGEGGDGYSSSLCLAGSLDPKFVKGKIVVCDRGINSRGDKGEVVKKAGGIGMILANGVFDGEGLVADCHVLPATAVGAIEVTSPMELSRGHCQPRLLFLKELGLGLGQLLWWHHSQREGLTLNRLRF